MLGALHKVPTLISTTTLSVGTDYAITAHINSTYDEYFFLMTDIHVSGDGANFQWNASDDTSSHSYDIAKQSAAWKIYIDESSGEGMDTMTSSDLTSETGYQQLANSMGNGNDESGAGILQIFKPADTTFYKRFTSVFHYYQSGDEATTLFVSGAIETASAVTAINFQAHSGNLQSGKIRMYGL